MTGLTLNQGACVRAPWVISYRRVVSGMMRPAGIAVMIAASHFNG
jgi:hypothetical protein